ncbi:MAG: DDE-type integrase/transposase/recombinase [Burkholderiaceae bacterium]|nr:DDE-type integrase/transposase/recombinase [Burkholderiaceae bacterium]
MNEKNSDEIRYRRLAFTLFDKGKSPTHILIRIPRSRSWLFKWKQRFAHDGWSALDSLSTAPQHSPQQYTSETVSLILRVRQRLEKSKVGMVSARAIQQELLRLRLCRPPPSQTTIKRWLRQAGLIGATTASDTATYYPARPPAAEFVTFSCDWVARYLTGGEKVFVFHTIDLHTHALAQTIRADKSTASTCEHLLAACVELGRPDFLQLDNDAAFTGLGRHPRVFGHFVRTALYLGLELIFIPPAEPQRNHVVERVNGLWVSSFWEKDHFASRRQLLRKSPKFLTWYETYAPPVLGGLTISQARRQPRRDKLSRRHFRHLPPALPLTVGRLHFMRRVNEQGAIDILKEQWKVSKSLVGQYVWATLDTHQEKLFIYHRRSARAQPRLITQYAYEIVERVERLRPEYQRRARRVDILKII